MQIPRPKAAEPDSSAQSWETIQTVQTVRWVVGTSSWRAPVGLERKRTKVPVGIRRGFTIHGPFRKGSAPESPGGGSWAGRSPGNSRNCFLAGPAHLRIENPWPGPVRTWGGPDRDSLPRTGFRVSTAVAQSSLYPSGSISRVPILPMWGLLQPPPPHSVPWPFLPLPRSLWYHNTWRHILTLLSPVMGQWGQQGVPGVSCD